MALKGVAPEGIKQLFKALGMKEEDIQKAIDEVEADIKSEHECDGNCGSCKGHDSEEDDHDENHRLIEQFIPYYEEIKIAAFKSMANDAKTRAELLGLDEQTTQKFLQFFINHIGNSFVRSRAEAEGLTEAFAAVGLVE